MTPEDRRYIGKELAFRGGSGSAAAAPEAGTRGRRTSTAQLASAEGSILPEASTLNDDAQTRQTLLKTTALQQVPAMGHVSGSLYSVGSSGSFGFDMKLSSGEITNGTINLSSPSIGVFGGFSANLSGGTGLADATGFKREGANEALFHSNFKLLLNSP